MRLLRISVVPLALVSLSSLTSAPMWAQRGVDAQDNRSQPKLPPSPSTPYFSAVRPLYSGARAKETVAFLDGFVRWPGNRGFDASIAHIAQKLEQAGYKKESSASARDRLIYRIEHYPMATPAWEPTDAQVEIIGDSAPLLRFATNRNMLATNSWATSAEGVEGEVVDVGNGAPNVWDAANVKGKIVYASANLGRVFGEAMQRGALGVLSYANPDYLQPAKNRHSIQFGGIPYDSAHKSWGVSLSFEANERLHKALSAGVVRARVRTAVTWTPNAVEQTVVAEVRGSRTPNERFVYSAHVQEPGANDNASGVGAQVEMARVAAELLRNRRIDPLRTITFLWGLEIRSTDRYLTQDVARAKDVLWGLSLDMVGEDTKKTGGTFLIEKMPDPSAVWTRGDDHHTEWGGRPLTKSDLTPHFYNDFVLQRCLEQAATNGWVVKTNPFEGGSDHTPFLKAKKPGLLMWHFADQFYHTDGDRMDMVSADELKNVGVSALVAGLTLTSATSETARAIVAEIARAAEVRLTTELRLSEEALASGARRDVQRDILETWGSWYDGALESTKSIEIGGASAETVLAIDRARRKLREQVKADLAKIAGP